MKKVLVVLSLVLVVAFNSNAQDYKKFKVGVGLGYGAASGSGSKGGLIFTIEPAYRLSDDFSLGLRMESALLTRGYSQSISGGSFDVAAIGSYTLNGQYYLSKSGFRPFIGAGLGIYSLAAVSTTVSGGGISLSADLTAAESKIGFYPRLGFDAGHFTMSLDYNLVSATKVNAQLGGGEFKNNYLGVRLGFFLGGGKK
jgi:hypothetical protein